MPTANSFGTQTALTAGGRTRQMFSLPALEKAGFSQIARMPFSMKILLENLLRCEDGRFVKAADIEALAKWDLKSGAQREISFAPARVLLQDFTGVPAVVDLAAMRDGIKRLGGDPNRVNPLQPVELVIDHSVQVDHFGMANAFQLNAELEFSRNKERYEFLRWGQDAFRNFRVVPPDTGIVHQVNLEYLARVVMSAETPDGSFCFPDTLVGTDSHTTMVNGLGVMGWGVGGIEAEAAMLGQPISMLIPQVLGFRLVGTMLEGATATDLVLTITEKLRKHGVVGKFVEFFGPGLEHLTIADRATLGNMCPEYGATIAIFPIDDMTLDYLRLTGREADQVALVEAYAKAQGLFRRAGDPDPIYTEVVELDLVVRGTESGGPEASAGSGVAEAGQEQLPGRARRDAGSDQESAGCRRAGGASGGGRGGDDQRRRRRRGRRGGNQAGSMPGRSRVGRDCSDHQLHEYVEPERDDRGGPGRQEGGRARVEAQAVGQDQPRARLEGRDRISAQRRSRHLSRRARIQPGRLRLHDLHRQQRSAARRSLRRNRIAESRRRLGPERQPELRRPHSAAGAGELSGVAAAGGRLRAGRPDDAGPDHRAARHRQGRRSRLPA